MDIHIYVDRPNHEIILACSGYLDLATRGEVTEALTAFAADRFTRVTLDLSGIRFCDCAGLNALITAHHAITKTGGHLRVVHPQPAIRRLLRVAECDWLLGSRPLAPASG